MLIKFFYFVLCFLVASFLFDLYNDRPLLMFTDVLMALAVGCIIFGLRELAKIKRESKQ